MFISTPGPQAEQTPTHKVCVSKFCGHMEAVQVSGSHSVSPQPSQAVWVICGCTKRRQFVIYYSEGAPTRPRVIEPFRLTIHEVMHAVQLGTWVGT